MFDKKELRPLKMFKGLDLRNFTANRKGFLSHSHRIELIRLVQKSLSSEAKRSKGER